MKIPEIILKPVEGDHRITIYSVAMISALAMVLALAFLYIKNAMLLSVSASIISLLILYYSAKVMLEYFAVTRDYIILKDVTITIQRIPTLSYSIFPKRYENIPYKAIRKLEVITLRNIFFLGLTKKALLLTVETSEGTQHIVFGDRLPDEELEKLNNILLMMSGISEKVKRVKNKVLDFLGSIIQEGTTGTEKDKEGGEES